MKRVRRQKTKGGGCHVALCGETLSVPIFLHLATRACWVCCTLHAIHILLTWLASATCVAVVLRLFL